MIGNTLLAQASLLVLAASTVLSFRSQRIASLLGGLSHQMRLHHGVALVGLGLVLVHAVVEFVDVSNGSFMALFDQAVWFDSGLASGLVAATGFLILTALAMTAWLRHRLWLWIHRVTLLLLVLVIFHALQMNVVGDEFQGGALTLVVIGFSLTSVALGLLGMFWVPSQRHLRVVAVKQIFPGFVELLVDPDPKEVPAHGKRLRYPAGYVVYVRFKGSGWTKAWHPFSVASCQSEGELRLLVRMCGQDTSRVLLLEPGAVLDVRGPFRDLLPWPDTNEVWLAAGVGIAPFIGFLHCASALKLGKVCLVHFDRNAHESAAVQKICEELACGFCDPQGRPMVEVRAAQKSLHSQSEAEIIAALAREFPAARFLICGSPAFMKWARKLLLSVGVQKGRLNTEELKR